MKRTHVNARTDQRIFSRTAAQTRLVNVVPMIMRGGFRL